jgi:Arc/MetJ-type ribon-helix-helix transcriptional regulator
MRAKTDAIWISEYLHRRLVAMVDGVRFKSISEVVQEGMLALAERDAIERRTYGHILDRTTPGVEVGDPLYVEGQEGTAAVPTRDYPADRVSNVDWRRAVFLHTGWAAYYDGSEAPEGGHAYLQQAVGVEAENFKPVDGWCFGYAPVSRTAEGRKLDVIPEANRTIKIEKLGASKFDQQVDGIMVVWTARHPVRGPVIVGLYDDATVFRFMPGLTDGVRPFIAKARVGNCHLLPEARRTFGIVQKQKGFPGMAAAWFPGLHADGPAKEMLDDVKDYLPSIRRYSYQAA